MSQYLIRLGLLALLGTAWAQSDSGFELVVLDAAVANATGALCLSGSPPGYYFRPGQGADSLKIKIHFRGGGWCFDEPSCLARANSSLGNSSWWPATPAPSEGVYGFMTNNATTNPRFANWTAAFVEYCDGSSFLSDRAEPVEVNGVPIYLRGRRILDAVLADLEARAGLLSRSEAVVIGGTSAGGIATYTHAEYIRSRVWPNATVHALPDAGFFLDHPNTQGVYAFRASVQGAVAPLWNATGSLNAACVAAMPTEDSWKCFFPQYSYPFITSVPVYVLNSLYDSASLSFILQLGCTPNGSLPGTCNATQLAWMQAYHDALLAALAPVQANPRDGLFATACYQHEESCRDWDWDGVLVDGVLDRLNFEAWYFGLSSTAKVVDGRWPSNPTCVYNLTHGGC